ncbi:suppressor of tub2 mutation [Malassezia yamatoensis]|uniref:Suppressor of tub2 mutation n=1 Tax=Malassezia yamatoensis TaxID=253288 RepID=A0AAJ5YSK5_9BASI|nr:suppressor of tub2 mutation [Malassezia yamatoensis]
MQVDDLDSALLNVVSFLHTNEELVTLKACHALERLLAEPKSLKNTLTVMRAVLPTVWEQMAEKDGEQRKALQQVLTKIAHAAYAADTRSVRQEDAPYTVWERFVCEKALNAPQPSLRISILQVLKLSEADKWQQNSPAIVAGILRNLQDNDRQVNCIASEVLTVVGRVLYASKQEELQQALDSAEISDELRRSVTREWQDAQRETPPRARTMMVLESLNSMSRDSSSEITTNRPESSMTRSTSCQHEEVVESSSPKRSLKHPLPSSLRSIPMDDVRIVALYSRYDLDKHFVLEPFQGKESELNWQSRERVILALRGALKNKIPNDLRAAFLASVRRLQDAVVKAVSSLRTTLSMHAIQLVRQLTLEYGPQLETTLDAWYLTLIRMAGSTKRMVANTSQLAVSTILAVVFLRSVHWHQLQNGIKEKSQATRLHMCKHIGTILQTQSKEHIEAHHGVESVMHCLEKALSDPTTEVRTAARETFALFHQSWPIHAAQLVHRLPTAAQKSMRSLLEKKEPKQPSRAKPSSTVIAAKRAAIQANSPRQSYLPTQAKDRAPRPSVWHPSLADTTQDQSTHTDTSSDLVNATNPWSGSHTLSSLPPHTPQPRNASAIDFARGNVSFSPPIQKYSADARRSAEEATTSAAQLSNVFSQMQVRPETCTSPHNQQDTKNTHKILPNTNRQASSPDSRIETDLKSDQHSDDAKSPDSPSKPGGIANHRTEVPTASHSNCQTFSGHPLSRYFFARCTQEDKIAGDLPAATCIERISHQEYKEELLRDLGHQLCDLPANFFETQLHPPVEVLQKLAEALRDEHLTDSVWNCALYAFCRMVQYLYRFRFMPQDATYWLETVFVMNSTSRTNHALAQGASRVILSLWAEHTQWNLAYDMLRSASHEAQADCVKPNDHAAIQVLSMYALGCLFNHAPTNDMQSFLGKTQRWIQESLSDRHPSVRRAAIDALVQAHRSGMDVQHMQQILPLSRTQASLLQHYIDQAKER